MLNISRKPHEAEASFRNRHHRFAQQQWFESWDFSHLLAFIIRGKWLADHSSWLATLITSDSRITWNYLLLLLSIIYHYYYCSPAGWFCMIFADISLVDHSIKLEWVSVLEALVFDVNSDSEDKIWGIWEGDATWNFPHPRCHSASVESPRI